MMTHAQNMMKSERERERERETEREREREFTRQTFRTSFASTIVYSSREHIRIVYKAPHFLLKQNIYII
jgi:hypothetical protein